MERGGALKACQLSDSRRRSCFGDCIKGVLDVSQTPHLAHYPRVAAPTLLVFKTDFSGY